MSRSRGSDDVEVSRPLHADRRPAGRARFAGWIVLVEAGRNEVAALVPEDISLPPAAGSADTHPLVFVFGEITHTMVRVGGVWVPTGKPFREFGVYVPNARFGRDATDHLVAARIWSSYRPSWWSGNFHYGLAKRQARMWWQQDVFLVADAASGQLVAHAHLEPAGEPGRRETTTLLDHARSMFTQPVLGHRLDGRPVRFHFRWGHRVVSSRSGAGAVTLVRPRSRASGAVRFASEPGRAVQVDGLVWDIGWPG